MSTPRPDEWLPSSADRLGYVRQMMLSYDAACFSRVTPPSWHAAHAPHWHFENLATRVVPMLLAGEATNEDIHQMMVLNPAALPTPSPATAGARHPGASGTGGRVTTAVPTSGEQR